MKGKEAKEIVDAGIYSAFASNYVSAFDFLSSIKTLNEFQSVVFD